jgi:peptidoglycan/LPS O-acetylase OafA/YrhL
VRNRYFDVLRALAIIRVVVYHATGWAVLTIVFPAMGTMFALSGSLMATSLDRYGVRAVSRRARRLLPPLWAMAAVFVPAMMFTGLTFSWRLLLWIVPLADPPTNGWGGTMLGVVWYLRQYLWFVLLSPLALPLFRRWPVPTFIAPFGLLVAIELGLPQVSMLRDLAVYFGCWLLGFAHHDGMLERLPRRVLPAHGVLTSTTSRSVTRCGQRGSYCCCWGGCRGRCRQALAG